MEKIRRNSTIHNLLNFNRIGAWFQTILRNSVSYLLHMKFINVVLDINLTSMEYQAQIAQQDITCKLREQFIRNLDWNAFSDRIAAIPSKQAPTLESSLYGTTIMHFYIDSRSKTLFSEKRGQRKKRKERRKYVEKKEEKGEGEETIWCKIRDFLCLQFHHVPS